MKQASRSKEESFRISFEVMLVLQVSRATSSDSKGREKMNQWEEDDRRRQGEMFTLIYGIWTFLFQVGVLAPLSVIAWKLW